VDEALIDPTGKPETFVQKGMFVRRSTGLVRDIPFVSQILVNIGPAAPGIGLAISVFWVLAAFPGAHLLPAFWITGLIGLLIVLPYGLLSMAMPRSGGDYILVSRSLGPNFGLASSVSFTLSQILGIGFVSTTFASVGVVPALATIGLLTGQSSWINLSNTLATQNWRFVLSIGILIVGLLIGMLPNRHAMRLQNVGYAIAGLGMLTAVILMFGTSPQDFGARFDQLVGSGTYEHVLEAASAQGLANPESSWANTVPAIGALGYLFFFSWWTTSYAGEIQGGRTLRNVASMALSILLLCVLFTVVTSALYHMTGGNFLAAANALNGTKDYPLSVPHLWVALAAIGGANVALGVFMLVTFLFWFPVWTFINLAPATRALFAWSFDGVLPAKTAAVSGRFHSPVGALAITGVAAAIAIAWAIYSSTFTTVLALLVLLPLTAMASVAWSAILVPRLRPEIWKRTAASGRVAGIPLLTVIGIVAFVAVVCAFSILMSYPSLGIADRGTALIYMAGSWLLGFAFYYVARAIQLRRGVDIALNYREVPPE
jgi:basic amino acid/polyamine antiporter, APA family